MSPPSYNGKLPLAERFRKLLSEGASPAEAVELLAELYFAFHFRIVQPLPGDPLFGLGTDGGLIVELSGHRLDPERVLTREPGLLDPVPIPLEQYRWMTADPRKAEQDALAELTIDALPTGPVSDPPPASSEGTASQPEQPHPTLSATSRTPEVKTTRRRGKTVEHPWEEAALYVDGWVEKSGPLERDLNGAPVVQRGIDLMLKGFAKARDPKPPSERYIRTWINNHPMCIGKWWGADN